MGSSSEKPNLEAIRQLKSDRGSLLSTLMTHHTAASHGASYPSAAPSDIARLQHPALPIKVSQPHVVIEILASPGAMAGINWSL